MALSDHSAVTLLLGAVPEIRGPGSWRFDNDLLGEEEFTSAMSDFLDAYTPPDLPSAHSRWDFFKYEIRNFTIAFQKKIRSENKRKRREHEIALKSLAKLNLVHDPYREQEYMTHKRELAELELAEANKTILRAKANWARWGKGQVNTFSTDRKGKPKIRPCHRSTMKMASLPQIPRKFSRPQGYTLKGCTAMTQSHHPWTS